MNLRSGSAAAAKITNRADAEGDRGPERGRADHPRRRARSARERTRCPCRRRSGRRTRARPRSPPLRSRAGLRRRARTATVSRRMSWIASLAGELPGDPHAHEALDRLIGIVLHLAPGSGSSPISSVLAGALTVGRGGDRVGRSIRQPTLCAWSSSDWRCRPSQKIRQRRAVRLPRFVRLAATSHASRDRGPVPVDARVAVDAFSYRALAIGLLQVFALAVMVIPSDTVLSGLGAVGYPASLLGLCTFVVLSVAVVLGVRDPTASRTRSGSCSACSGSACWRPTSRWTGACSRPPSSRAPTAC